MTYTVLNGEYWTLPSRRCVVSQYPPKYGVPGSVSHGTMNPAHLIPAFLDELRAICPYAHRDFIESWADFDFDLLEDWYDCSDSYREDVLYLLEELFDVLDRYAPPNHYFGALEGDGADYGFWPIVDSTTFSYG